jgi:hypothetical protein
MSLANDPVCSYYVCMRDKYNFRSREKVLSHVSPSAKRETLKQRIAAAEHWSTFIPTGNGQGDVVTQYINKIEWQSPAVRDAVWWTVPL